MFFYNPITKEILDKKKLSLLYNTSISKDTEVFEHWYRIHYTERPEINEFQKIKENEVQLIDEVYTITYSVIDEDLERVKSIKKERINNTFDKVYNSKNLKVLSSLGFEINANSVANTNIDGLIKVLKKTGMESVMFRAFNNELHNVTLEDLETMQMEIIMNGQTLYTKKWEMENLIDCATNIDELLEIEDDFFHMI